MRCELETGENLKIKEMYRKTSNHRSSCYDHTVPQASYNMSPQGVVEEMEAAKISPKGEMHLRHLGIMDWLL